MITSVDIVVDDTEVLQDAIDFLEDNYVLVGIPDSKPPNNIGLEEDPSNIDTQREISNAELLFIHTNGSPINNIPARPVIEPAIVHNRATIYKLMKNSAIDAMAGNIPEARLDLEDLGQHSSDVCKKWFVDPANGWPENVPSVKRRKMKKGSSEPRPLIDTGQLRKSITYVMVRDGGRQD